jgi:hypothetical protein
MLDLLAMLKKGYCDGMKVRIGRLQNLISSSCIGMRYQGLIMVFGISFFSRELYEYDSTDVHCIFPFYRTFGLYEHSRYIWDNISAVSSTGTWIHWLSESYGCSQSITICWRSQDIWGMHIIALSDFPACCSISCSVKTGYYWFAVFPINKEWNIKYFFTHL